MGSAILTKYQNIRGGSTSYEKTYSATASLAKCANGAYTVPLNSSLYEVFYRFPDSDRKIAFNDGKDGFFFYKYDIEARVQSDRGLHFYIGPDFSGWSSGTSMWVKDEITVSSTQNVSMHKSGNRFFRQPYPGKWDLLNALYSDSPKAVSPWDTTTSTDVDSIRRYALNMFIYCGSATYSSSTVSQCACSFEVWMNTDKWNIPSPSL